MSEVKYEDEKKLLTSDEFIAAAKQNADKNLQIQKDTAQKVYDSTYESLDRQYNEAAAAAGVAKERNLIDTDTAYQRQEMKYGAEQEALAAAGLSGSGMNEYRRAQSYQKNREDRQMSYAEYDRALREANYTRDQGKLAADLNKAQSDAAAEMHYNDTMTGIAEKELGYAELERQEISTAYGSYINGINDGSMTLDQIKADASWAKLSPEQQASVEKTAKIKGIKTKIDNGESWESIAGSYAYLELEEAGDEDGINQVKAYYAEIQAGKTKDANAASGNYLEMAMNGMSIDSIVALAQANGHYQTLVDSGFWNAVTAEAERVANEQSKAEGAENDANYLGLLGDINSGALTIDAIKNTTIWGTLSGPQQAQLEAAAALKGKTEMKDRMGVYADLAAKGVSLEDIKTMMAINGDKYVEELTPEEYEKLSDEEKAEYDEARNFMKLIESSAGKYAEDKKAAELKEQNYINDTNFTSWLSAIGSGALTLDDAKAMSGYGDLTAAQKKQLLTADNNRKGKESLAAKTERADRIVTYGDLARGGMSLEELKATMALYGDDWDNLDPKEQKVIQMAADAYTAAQEKLNSENETERALGYADLAENGYSIDDIKSIMAMYGDQYISKEDYDKLSDDDKKKYADARKFSEVIDRAITRYSNLKTEVANKDAKGALAAYIEAAGEGLSIDAITAIAIANGHYDVLVGTKTEEGKEGEESKTLWDSVVAEADKYTKQNATNDTLTNIENAIKDGATLEEIESMPGYDELDPEVREQIGEQVTARDEEKDIVTESIALSLEGYESLSDVEKLLASEMVPEKDRPAIIAKWQSNNVKEFEELFADAKFENGAMSIGGVEITGEDLYEDIKNGMYGDKGGEVFGKYLDLLVQTAIDTTTSISDAFAIQGLLNTLENDLRAAKMSDLELLVSKAKQKVPKNVVVSSRNTFGYETIDGKKYTTIDGVAVEDAKSVPESVIAELEKIVKKNASTTANVKTIQVRDTIYYKDDLGWVAYKIVQNSASTSSNKGGTTR